ncbi:hypothetical protein C9J03_13775 [Photobacterium gaetbulicola]|uniref:Uncharacterized protein n=1 Tax=Photobacterium gaetbulicola Gung47 TaxID=658445 RepID=A0A0C5WTE9_9GAMM|nr:hypothetical protein [Photobacterium gaetbulicola]AJR06275.1 hypothetical protein H744_1c1251 [Photobacterium gaetbulicola Gung47]PSU08780.1 hypothetical protein C9J03_13775 [Photobacterium gaetbulicola]
MSDQKTQKLLQLFYRETERVRLLDLDKLPTPDSKEQDALQVWLAGKRDFALEELTQQHWIKTCSAGHTTELVLYPNGCLEEFTLFRRQKTAGEWQLINGMLVLSIYKDDNRYTSTVIANLGSSIHSAIEYKNDQLHAYLKLAQTRPQGI